MGLRVGLALNGVFGYTPYAHTPLDITLTSTGTGEGVATLRLATSEDVTLELSEGNAKFYTDAAGTIGNFSTWTVSAGALRTIYIKAVSGTTTLTIPKPTKVIQWGTTSTTGWDSPPDAPSLAVDLTSLTFLEDLKFVGASTITGTLPTGLKTYWLISHDITWTYEEALPTGLTSLSLAGNLISWTYTGDLPEGLTYLILSSPSIAWTSSAALPQELTTLVLDSASMDWTSLNVSGTGNITSTFLLTNYRQAKMSSEDMLVLLGSLTDRVGMIPANLTINDYEDFASPPQDVLDAVAALKLAHTNVNNVTLGE